MSLVNLTSPVNPPSPRPVPRSQRSHTTRRTQLVALLVLFGSLAWLGCAGGTETAEEGEGEGQVYVVRGIFARPEFDGEAMHVRHEEIPGYMAAMTMSFRLEDPAAIEGLEYGDKIEFDLHVDDKSMIVHDIRRLDPATELDFGDE